MMKDKNSLIVSETFYSIQGEGHTAGTPAVFLRLAGCNLLCSGDGWRCDTIEVWKKGRHTPFENVLKAEYVEALARGAHLVITGGEPLLHQEQIVKYLWWFVGEYQWKPIVEIETNATIFPNEHMRKMVSFWNLSPKLSGSGETASKRINELVLNSFYSISQIKPLMYKFVISKAYEELEIFQDYSSYIDMRKVWLMPAGATQDELAVMRAYVIGICKLTHFKYSDRLHIVAYNQKTGV